MSSRLPDQVKERLDWIVEAARNPGLSESRYDTWADQYDADNQVLGWCAPAAAVAEALECLDLDAQILDAGAGSGLVGEALAAAGYRNLVGADRSAQMLDVARGKGLYRALHKLDLTEPLPFADQSFDAVLSIGTSGYLTTGAVQEFVRVVRPEGHILITISDHWYSHAGFRSAFEDREHAGLLCPVRTGPEFVPLPRGYPSHLSRVRVFLRTDENLDRQARPAPS